MIGSTKCSVLALVFLAFDVNIDDDDRPLPLLKLPANINDYSAVNEQCSIINLD